jgi:hypothetical protein
MVPKKPRHGVALLCSILMFGLMVFTVCPSITNWLGL